MGYALWIDRDLAWAQGTHEYRPMGTAVIASNGLFAPRDFDPRRMPPSPRDPSFAGLFASLEDLNRQLRSRSRNASLERQRSILPASGPRRHASVPSRVPLADARGSEALILSRDREGAVVKSNAGHHTRPSRSG